MAIKPSSYLHIIVGIFVLLFPIIVNEEYMTGGMYLRSFVVLFSYLFIFYLNYLLLIDKLFFNKSKLYLFFIVNLIIILLFWFGLQVWRDLDFRKNILPQIEKIAEMPMMPPHRIFLMTLRDILLMIATVGLSLALKLSFNYYKLKEQALELIKLRTESELAALKNQLNPHFLFNTLNNIYSLISISQSRAQQAVHDLSRLMRYALYEGNKDFVLLESEIQFVRNYVNIMALRLGKSVSLRSELPGDVYNLWIAPMLFISLIENAFKHGVANGEASFIDISIRSFPNRVVCKISNSISIKPVEEEGGIGLENLRKRLELLYPNRYTFTNNVEGGVYVSELIIILKDE